MYDLDAVANEDEGIPFDFTFGGEKYQLPPVVDLVAAAALDGGQLYDGLRRLLGASQWDRLVASEAVLDTPRLKALMEAYGEHLGVTLGESAASTGSSGSTAKP